MTKINDLNVKGIRGIRTELSLPLNGKSILLYGDNGSGKSSLSDVVEWFFYGRIEHLCSEEIGKKGIDGLRNTFLDDDEKSFAKFDFTDNNLNAEKTISVKKEKLTHKCLNNSNDFKGYIKDSQKENLILRYKDLMSFILATKTEKLNDLSNIIGFSQVKDTRYTFMKIVNELKKDLKPKNFDNQINTQQAHLIKQLGHNVTSDNQFIRSINKLVEPLEIDEKITKLKEIDKILDLIKKPEDSKIIELQHFYNELSDIAKNIPSILDGIESSYKQYYTQFQKIREDIDIINKIVLEKLLSEGITAIKRKRILEDICPLCLQPKDRNELLRELEKRIGELKEFKKEKIKLEEQKESINKLIEEWVGKIKIHLPSEHIKLEENEELKRDLQNVKSSLAQYTNELDIELSDIQNPKTYSKLVINRDIFKRIVNFCDGRIQRLKESKKRGLRFETHSKIEVSRKAYSDIKKLQKEKELIEKQLRTMEIVFNEFVKKQKEGLETFLNYISKDVNDIYQFMHPGERVEDIKLSLIEKGDELIGVTIEYKFFDNEVAPPNKYLSESHLNCLGIAIFLTSVKAFNERNKFFILDDVISSFDTDHRKRFADLMVEKFSDYQIIIMTHEMDWFDYVKNIVKGKNWKINTIKWNEDRGTYVDEPPEKLKDRIKSKISKSDETGLGNDIRKYLEHTLKQVALNLEVKLKFQFNDANEKRMSYELLTELKSTIKKRNCSELTECKVFDRLLSSVYIGNIGSHNGSSSCNIGDLKAFWGDVIEFEELFYCPSCEKYISHRYYDQVNKNIRCGCGEISYNWKN